MTRFSFASAKPHLIALLIFIVVSLVYFSPLLEGKRLRQSDIIQHTGMSKEVVDYRAKTGKEPLWTNSMFGGMPTYQVSTYYPSDLMVYLDRLLDFELPQPAGCLFKTLLGFYFLMLVFGTSWEIATIGALLYAFSSYFFIILDAGHNSKANAMAYLAPTIAAFIMLFRGRYLLGGTLTALFLALEIDTNHFQITYYLFIVLLLLSIYYIYEAFKTKAFKQYLISAVIFGIGIGISLIPNVSRLWTTYDYTNYSTRGASELKDKKSSTGLDKDYALGWSYGIGETFTLLIPDFMGGSSGENIGTHSETYKTLQSNGVPSDQSRQFVRNAPTYWGDQPFTSGPVYVGAIVIFLAVLGFMLWQNNLRWAMLVITLISFFMAWGKHFDLFSGLMFDYFPGYNKFRTVSMALVIAGVTIPLLAGIGLKEFFTNNNVPDKKKKLFRAFAYTAGICLIFVLIGPSIFDFKGENDKAELPAWLTDSLLSDRASLFRTDALRSLVFISLCYGALHFYLAGKLKKQYAFIALGFLGLLDMWLVDKRYLNSDNFVAAQQVKNPFNPSRADQQILQDKDPNYRVLNLAVNTFNDASTSYFHKSVGGYHAAKPKRYQELIENQISKNNMEVLNMLNTKYIILPNKETNEPFVQRNPSALGNSWFVKDIKIVANADSELNALSSFNAAATAILDKRFAPAVSGLGTFTDSTAKITLESYAPNDLVYSSSSKQEGLAVFSEAYYDKGWKATIDGKETPHIRVNYVLRGLRIPQGNHKIEFKFEPEAYYTGEKISLAGSLLLFVLVIIAIGFEIRSSGKEHA